MDTTGLLDVITSVENVKGKPFFPTGNAVYQAYKVCTFYGFYDKPKTHTFMSCPDLIMIFAGDRAVFIDSSGSLHCDFGPAVSIRGVEEFYIRGQKLSRVKFESVSKITRYNRFKYSQFTKAGSCVLPARRNISASQ